jgi:SdrD B-like domain
MDGDADDSVLASKHLSRVKQAAPIPTLRASISRPIRPPTKDGVQIMNSPRFVIALLFLLGAFLTRPAVAQYIYVANAGEDTVSKIDINSNIEVARYATWFTSGTNQVPPHPGNPWNGPAPSRLLQDPQGNLYVLNRFFGAHLPVLVKIAPTGGIPGVTTSSGAVLPILDANSNNDIDSGEASDVRIQWAKSIGTAGDIGQLGRALCLDPSGVLWVGVYGSMRYYRVNATTGAVLGPAISTAPHKPYGCQVDAQGRLWSVDASQTLVEIDTSLNQLTASHSHAPFGLNYSPSIFNGCGLKPSKVYLANWNQPKTYIAYDPLTTLFSNAPITVPQFRSAAVAVDRNGDIVSGEYNTTGRVIKSSPTGSVIWDTNSLPAGPVVPAADLHGVIVDDNNDVWAVHLHENRLVKYSGVDGHWIATVPVGDSPYSYSNPPSPTCACAEVREHTISCKSQTAGIGTYSWSSTIANHSPFSTPATTLNISSSQVTNLTPTQVQFTNPLPVNGQVTVAGTFTVANPVPGSQVCLDLRLNAGEGWCCPKEPVCFVLPKCQNCATVEAVIKCVNGRPTLFLTVTHQGPSPAQSIQITSNTPGVTVTPQVITQTFPPNTPITISVGLTGATPGQTISLGIGLDGPVDPKNGTNTWCCETTVTIVYPRLPCAQTIDGWIFQDLNRDGHRNSGEDGLAGWIITLTDSKSARRTTTSDSAGTYRFLDVEQGTYRLSVEPRAGWKPTLPSPALYSITVADPPGRKFLFGFEKTSP